MGQTMSLRPVGFTNHVTLLVVLAALLACKKAPKPSSDPVQDGGAPSPAATALATAPYISERDLERVCNGEPLKAAKAYDATAAAIHPTIVLARRHDKGAFSEAHQTEFAAWKAKENGLYELVACVTPTVTTKVKDCKLESKGTVYSIELQDASFELAIYEAQTAKLVGKKSVDLKVERTCPSAAIVTQKYETRQPDYAKTLHSWAAQYVTPKAAGKRR